MPIYENGVNDKIASQEQGLARGSRSGAYLGTLLPACAPMAEYPAEILWEAS